LSLCRFLFVCLQMFLGHTLYKSTDDSLTIIIRKKIAKIYT
jgi:hypothetical protein